MVFGNATIARLSQDRTGFALGMSGFGPVAQLVRHLPVRQPLVTHPALYRAPLFVPCP